MIYRMLFLIFMALSHQLVYALDSDTEQPATLDADDMQIDMNSGVRVYQGNVVFRQGSIKMTCDELTTYFSDDGGLNEAVCIGGPGRFKQRPEGQPDDLVGTANTITLNQVEDLVTLKGRAKVVQGGTTITGKLITYNLVTEKASIKGGSTKSAGTSTAETPESTSESASSDTPSSEQETSEAVVEEENSRPSLVIPPRKKKEIEEEGEVADEPAVEESAVE